MAVVPECDVLAFVLNGKGITLENVNGLSLLAAAVALFVIYDRFFGIERMWR